LKELHVVEVKGISYNSAVPEIARFLDRLDKNGIDNVPWSSYPYKPSASFTVAYGPDCIFLKYFVSEKQIRAVNTDPNSPVWQDTCVEFFVSFNDGRQYYNFEINCIGTILAAYGPDREHRDFLADQAISQVKTFSLIDKFSISPDIKWELIAVIPFTSFIHDNISSLSGTSARANFYKCGDALKEPHYLAWSQINAPEPDFHLPAFFGKLHF
jgi:hypothetical protein